LSPDDDIFRPQARRFAERRLAGEVILDSRKPLKIASIALLAIMVAIVATACSASYARKESATGWLVTRRGVVRVQTQRAGVVAALPVTEGASLKPGQVLAALGSETASSALDARQVQARQIDVEASAAARQAAATLAELDAKRGDLQQRRRALVAQLAEARSQAGLLAERVEVEHARFDRNTPLANQGYVSRSTLDQMKSSWISAAQEASAARASMVALSQQISDVDGDLARAPLERANAQAAAEAASAQLTQKRAAFDIENTEVLRAPLPGRLLASPLTVGQTVGAGATVAVIAPADSPLEAELYVPARAIGFVRPGQPVRLKYQAFPFQKYGIARGVVRSVSYTLLAPAELSAPLTEIKEPTFRVRVSLPRQSLVAYGATIPLQPGMLTSGDIVFERRSLIRWLLDPLYAVRS